MPGVLVGLPLDVAGRIVGSVQVERVSDLREYRARVEPLLLRMGPATTSSWGWARPWLSTGRPGCMIF